MESLNGALTSMTLQDCNSDLFEELVRPMLERGMSVRFQARGASMSPAIRDGEIVEIDPVDVRFVRKGDIVLTKSNSGFRLHRVVVADPQKDIFITRGDCGQENDPSLNGLQILGLARAKDVRLGWMTVQASFKHGLIIRSAARVQYILGKAVRKTIAACR